MLKVKSVLLAIAFMYVIVLASLPEEYGPISGPIKKPLEPIKASYIDRDLYMKHYSKREVE